MVAWNQEKWLKKLLKENQKIWEPVSVYIS